MSQSKLFLMIFLGSLTISASAFAAAGGSDRGGGDAFAQEFTTLGRQALEEVKREQVRFPEIDCSQFEKAISETKIASVDSTGLDGVVKDAINYPSEGRIEINRARWSELTRSSQKEALVFHEYLGIMRVRDSDYGVSGRLLATLQSSSEKAGLPAVTCTINEVTDESEQSWTTTKSLEQNRVAGFIDLGKIQGFEVSVGLGAGDQGSFVSRVCAKAKNADAAAYICGKNSVSIATSESDSSEVTCAVLPK